MAEKSEPKETTVEVREKIDQSRELLARDWVSLRHELNFPLKFRLAFQRHTLVWVGGAIACGLLVALLRARTRKIYISAAGKRVRSPKKTLLESGAVLGVVKLGMTFLQPMIVSYLTKQAKKRAGAAGERWNR